MAGRAALMAATTEDMTRSTEAPHFFAFTVFPPQRQDQCPNPAPPTSQAGFVTFSPHFVQL